MILNSILKSYSSDYDYMWGVNDIGDTDSVWYLPSRGELVAFVDAFSIYSVNTYASLGLTRDAGSLRFMTLTKCISRSSAWVSLPLPKLAEPTMFAWCDFLNPYYSLSNTSLVKAT